MASEIKTVDDLRGAYPELVGEIEEAAAQEARNAERQRIQDIEEMCLPGSEDMTNEAKFTKPMSAEDYAKAVVKNAKKQGDKFLAGMAFNNASLGYVHAMAHQLGGFYNLPHGVCNAVLLPHVQVFNSKVAAARLRDCAAAMGVNVTGKNDAEGAEACINAIRELAKKVDIPAGLRALNVTEEDFAVLATNALKDACGFTNPIQATHEEIVAIYRAAM